MAAALKESLMRRSMGGAVEDDRRRDGETKYKKT